MSVNLVYPYMNYCLRNNKKFRHRDSNVKIRCSCWENKRTGEIDSCVDDVSKEVEILNLFPKNLAYFYRPCRQ